MEMMDPAPDRSPRLTSDRVCLVLLGLYLAFFVHQQLAWMAASSALPYDNATDHLANSVQVYDILKGTPFPQSLANVLFPLIQEFLPLHGVHVYPPFLYLLTATLDLLLGPSLFTAELSLLLFALVFILATFGIGRRLFDAEVGLVAAIVASGAYRFVQYTREYFLDVPVCALVALSLYLLLASCGLRRRTISVLLGLSLALGLLVKWIFVVYVALPLAWVAVEVLWRVPRRPLSRLGLFALSGAALLSLRWAMTSLRPEGFFWLAQGLGALALALLLPDLAARLRWRPGLLERVRAFARRELDEPGRLTNLALVFLGPLVLAGPWYARSLPTITRQFMEDSSRLFQENPGTILSVSVPGFGSLGFSGLLGCLSLLWNQVLSPLVLLCGAVGCVLLLVRRRDRASGLSLILTFGAAYLLLSSIATKDYRFLLPLLPWIALLATGWLRNLRFFRFLLEIPLLLLSLFALSGWRFSESLPNRRLDGFYSIRELDLSYLVPYTDLGRFGRPNLLLSQLPEKDPALAMEVFASLEPLLGEGRGKVLACLNKRDAESLQALALFTRPAPLLLAPHTSAGADKPFVPIHYTWFDGGELHRVCRSSPRASLPTYDRWCRANSDFFASEPFTHVIVDQSFSPGDDGTTLVVAERGQAGRWDGLSASALSFPGGLSLAETLTRSGVRIYTVGAVRMSE